MDLIYLLKRCLPLVQKEYGAQRKQLEIMKDKDPNIERPLYLYRKDQIESLKNLIEIIKKEIEDHEDNI